MDKTMNEEILKRIDLLSKNLGVASGHIWQVMVHQQFVDAITDLFSGVLALVVMGFAIKCAMHLFGKRNEEDGDTALSCLFFILSMVTAGISLVVGVAYLTSVPTELLNPEYGAFHELLKAAQHG